MIIHLTKDTFDQEVLQSDVPVLVDFWAKWCGPCLRVAPILEELSEEIKGHAKICKLEVDDEEDIADFYEVMSIPTLIVFKNGEITETEIGVKSKDFMKKMLGL